jgi:hypothetical protein
VTLAQIHYISLEKLKSTVREERLKITQVQATLIGIRMGQWRDSKGIPGWCQRLGWRGVGGPGKETAERHVKERAQ